MRVNGLLHGPHARVTLRARHRAHLALDLERRLPAHRDRVLVLPGLALALEEPLFRLYVDSNNTMIVS